MEKIFNKLVAIEPVHLLPEAEEELKKLAHEVILHRDTPRSQEEVAERIGDADAVMVSFITPIERETIENAPSLRYIGMCCSLYDENSANVDIAAARSRGIVVKGIRDYGDPGVLEFVISELVQLFHGYAGRMWRDGPRELTGLKVGIIGMGVTGRLLSDGFKLFGAERYYYSRTRKADVEADGVEYRELNELLGECEVICACVNKNNILLHKEQFETLGNRKILVSTVGSPVFDMEPFKEFLEGDNYFLCDMLGSLGDLELLNHPNVRCTGRASGVTSQAKVRLSEKVLTNIKTALKEINLN